MIRTLGTSLGLLTIIPASMLALAVLPASMVRGADELPREATLPVALGCAASQIDCAFGLQSAGNATTLFVLPAAVRGFGTA